MRLHLHAPDSARSAVRAPDRPQPAGDTKVVAVRLAGGVVLLFGLIWLIGLAADALRQFRARCTRPTSASTSGSRPRGARARGIPSPLVGTTMAQTETVIGVRRRGACCSAAGGSAAGTSALC